MPLPGISEREQVIPLLRRLISDPEESFNFAVAASGPKEGSLALSKKERLKKKDVRAAAEADAKKASGGKAVRFEVMTGECRLDAKIPATLRLVVYGKAPAKAVSCAEHLLVRGDYKVVGFKGVILEEVADDEEGGESTGSVAPTQPTTSDSPTPPSLAEQWEQALAAIEPSYSQALRERPDDAKRLGAVMGFARAKAEANDFAAGLSGLEKLRELLKEEPQKTDKSPSSLPSGDLESVWKARVTEWTPAIKTAIVAQGPHSQTILKLLSQANSLSKPGGDLALAIEKLTECHALATSGAKPFDWTEVRKIWSTARGRIDADVEAFRKALLSNSDVAGDPRIRFVRSAAAEIPNLLPRTQGVNDALAGDDVATLRSSLDLYRQELAKAQDFARLEAYASENLKLKLAVRETLGEALTAMENKLPKTK